MSRLTDRVAGAVEPLTARFDAQLEAMSSRDRKLLFALALFATVVVVFGGGYMMMSTLNSLDQQLADRRSDVRYVEELAAEYHSAQASLEEIEEELRKNSGQDLSAFMEKSANAIGVGDRLDSVREKSVVELGSLEQKNYNVALSKLSLDETLKFLYEIEAKGYPLRVTNANFKVVKVSGEKKLNVKLDIAAYRLLNSEEG